MMSEFKKKSHKIGHFVEVYREYGGKYWWVRYNLHAGVYVPVETHDELLMVKPAFREFLDNDELHDIWDLFRAFIKRYVNEDIRRKRVSRKQVNKIFNKKPPLHEYLGRFKICIESSFGYLYGLQFDDAMELGKQLEELLKKALVLEMR